MGVESHLRRVDGDTMMHYPHSKFVQYPETTRLMSSLVLVYRNTPKDPILSEFSPGSCLRQRCSYSILFGGGTNSNSGRLEPWYNETFGSL